MANENDKKALISQLAELGITQTSGTDKITPLTGEETVKELKAIFKLATEHAEAAKKTGGDNKGKEGKADKPAAQDKETKGGFIVWLKCRAYVNAKQRVNPGVYRYAEVPERLRALTSDLCEIITGAPSARKLTQIAKWSGITHPEDLTDEVILSKIVTEPKPF